MQEAKREAYGGWRWIKSLVISTEAQRNGEIYLGRFCFAEPSGSRLRCTALEMTVTRRFLAID